MVFIMPPMLRSSAWALDPHPALKTRQSGLQTQNVDCVMFTSHIGTIQGHQSKDYPRGPPGRVRVTIFDPRSRWPKNPPCELDGGSRVARVSTPIPAKLVLSTMRDPKGVSIRGRSNVIDVPACSL